MERKIINDVIHKHTAKIDDILLDAFKEHFGFSLLDVKDVENLEHIVMRGEPIESFRYRGETFLYKENGEIEIDPYLEKPEWPQVSITTRYIKV